MTDRLTGLLKDISEKKWPPVESWNPQYGADMDLVISRSGDWIHEGRKIDRQKMVRLFASILKKEGNDYFLVTPVEKVKITVENTPFVVVSTEKIGDRWFMTDCLGDVVELTGASALDISDEQNPIVLWRRNLPARVHQNVMYQWQVYALDNDGIQQGKLYLKCADASVLVGRMDI